MKQAVESHRSLRVRARRAGKKKPKEEAPGEPNEIEIILYALLIVAHSGMGVKQLEQWVRKVLLDEARARALREAWKPLSLQDGDEAGWGLCTIGANTKVSLAFEPIARAVAGRTLDDNERISVC